MSEDTDEQATPMYVLQQAAPLSESVVWRLQRAFYSDQGIAAWSQSRVPQSVTTSPNIARAYARLVFGFWRDIRSSLDTTQPTYLVELGAGSGRFAYRFLHALGQLQEELGEAQHRFVYVMTDASPSVLDFWRDNPRLQPFVDAGVLDFAQFDLLDPAPLTLVTASNTLRPGELANPVVMIGNYIFDSIPQDAYEIKAGQLRQQLLTLHASTPELDFTSQASKIRISMQYSADEQAIDPEAEPDPVLRGILRSYQQTLDETTVLIQRPALACLRFFHALGGGRGLCVVADFGDTRLEDLQGKDPPGLGDGAGFWLPVNFHALGEYARGLGGHTRHPRSRHIGLNISMFRFGTDASSFPQTDLAYSDNIDYHSPDDLAVVARALGDQLAPLGLKELLGLLRTTGWDPDYVGRCLPRLLEVLPEAPASLRDDLARGLHQTWRNYYPIGELQDLPYGLGVLLYSLEHFAEALEFFERSLREFGEDPRTTLNLALTLYHLHRRSDALHWLDRTLELDPANDLASNMRPDVAAELASERAEQAEAP